MESAVRVGRTIRIGQACRPGILRVWNGLEWTLPNNVVGAVHRAKGRAEPRPLGCGKRTILPRPNLRRSAVPATITNIRFLGHRGVVGRKRIASARHEQQKNKRGSECGSERGGTHGKHSTPDTTTKTQTTKTKTKTKTKYYTNTNTKYKHQIQTPNTNTNTTQHKSTTPCRPEPSRRLLPPRGPRKACRLPRRVGLPGLGPPSPGQPPTG